MTLQGRLAQIKENLERGYWNDAGPDFTWLLVRVEDLSIEIELALYNQEAIEDCQCCMNNKAIFEKLRQALEGKGE